MSHYQPFAKLRALSLSKRRLFRKVAGFIIAKVL